MSFFSFQRMRVWIKATVVDVKPVDYKEYGRRLVMNIRRNAAM